MRLRPVPILVALLAGVTASGPARGQAADPWADLRAPPATEAGAAGEADDQPPDPAVTGAVRRVGAEMAIDTTDPEADLLAPPLRRTSPAIDPYEPLGIRAGSFILYPSLETTVGYSTNASGAAGGPASGFASLTPELRINSDWARHETTLAMRGTYETFADGTVDDRPTASIEGTARLDLVEAWIADLAASYHYRTQSVSDPNFPAGVDEPPGVHELTGAAALRGRLGRNVLEFGASLDRTVYEDGTSGGVEVDQGDRTNTAIGGRLRYGFAVTPLLTPFVEGDVTRRVYDRTLDNFGLERSGWTYGLRAGFAYESEPVLSGEIAIGYAVAALDDPGLSAIEALTFDGSLVWSPTALTTVSFNGSTALNPGTDPASSGSVLYDGSVGIAYRWRENVTLDAVAGVGHERFQGTGQEDTAYRLGLGATWRVNRALQLAGGYLHEWLESSDPTRDYVSDSVRVTLRLQR